VKVASNFYNDWLQLVYMYGSIIIGDDRRLIISYIIGNDINNINKKFYCSELFICFWIDPSRNKIDQTIARYIHPMSYFRDDTIFAITIVSW